MSSTSNTITTRVFDYSTALRPEKYNEARSTPAIYWNDHGDYTSAPPNAPRYDFDTATIYENLIPYSYDMTLTAADTWPWNINAATATHDGTLAPDGSPATRLQVENVGGVRTPELWQNIYPTVPGANYTFSVFAKPGDHKVVFVNIEGNFLGNSVWVTAIFNIGKIAVLNEIIAPTFTAVGSLAASGEVVNAYAQYVGDGWYRLVLVTNMDATNAGVSDTTMAAVVGLADDDVASLSGLTQWGEVYFNDPTTQYAYFANPQFELGVVANPYIATTDANPVISTATAKGLLVEPTRTNLIPDSYDFGANTWWNSDGAAQVTYDDDGSLAPDGSLTQVLSGGANLIYNLEPITILANTNHGLSFYAKAKTASYAYIAFEAYHETGAPNDARFATAVFDLTGHANGVATETFVGAQGGHIASTKTEYVGDGWFRCILVASVNDTACYAVFGYTDNATGNVFSPFGDSPSGATNKELRIAMPQLEQGNGATSYIKTKGGALTRTADDITFALNDIETSAVTFTFDDNSTQTLSAKGATIYSVPTNLQRPWVRYIDVQVVHKTVTILEDYNAILPFIEKQFPEFYQDQGPMFIEFVKAYYDWLSQTDGMLDKIRNFEKYHDIDTTLDEFLTHFTNAYLYGVPSSILGDKRFLIKHVLDVYRSKGTVQGYKLLFRLLYDEDIEVYLPQKDMLRLSDGTWYAPKYLEVSEHPLNASLVGKRIKGSASEAEAIVQDYIIQFVGKTVCVLYLSNITGEFVQGEKIIGIEDFDTIATLDAPQILGSLSSIALVSGGQNFSVGDILVPTNGTGREVQFRVKAVANGTGTLLYNIVDGGSLYSTSANTYLTRTTNAGHGSSFDIGGVSSVQTLDFNLDIIINQANSLINDPAYHFAGMDNANAATQIGDAFQFNNRLFGTIEHLTHIATGNNYTSPPVVTVKDIIYTGNLVGNVFWSNTTANVVGVGTDFTYYFHPGDYIGLFITHDSNPVNPDQYEHRIVKTVTNNTFLTLDDVPTTYGDSRIESIDIVTAGVGYANGAYLTFTDALGTGANAQIFTDGSGAITTIIFNSHGQHYISPTVTAPTGGGASLVALVDYGNFALGVPLISSQYSQTFLANALLNSEDGNNAIITATPQFGAGIISEVDVRSSGFGYHDDELLDFGTLGALQNVQLNNGGIGYANNDPLIFAGGAPVSQAVGSVITDANGTITTLNIVYHGSGYKTKPDIRVRTSDGSGADITADVGGLDDTFLISGYGVKSGVGKQQGFWTTTRGFLNSDKYIQDSFYYQQMSYEIQAPKTLELYADILKKVIHPAGYEMFGKYVYSDKAGQPAKEQSMLLLLSTSVAQLLNWFVDFTAGALPSWLTFTRTTSATYFNSSGVMVTASNNVPRFDYEYDGAHWNHVGLLIEEERTNIVFRSNQLTANTGGNPAWGWGSPLTIAASAVNSVDGTNKMWTLTNTRVGANTVAFAFYNSQNGGNGAAVHDNDTVTSSCYIKKGNLRYICMFAQFWTDTKQDGSLAIIDLDTGLIASSFATSPSSSLAQAHILSQSLSPVGNGMYRYTSTVQADPAITNGTGDIWFDINIAGAQDASGNVDAFGTPKYTWAGGETILVSHFQIEVGNSATSYIDTNDAAVTRTIDGLALTGGSAVEVAYKSNAASVIFDITNAKSDKVDFMVPTDLAQGLFINANTGGAVVGVWSDANELDTTNVFDNTLEFKFAQAFDGHGTSVASMGNTAVWGTWIDAPRNGTINVVHGDNFNFTGHLGELDLYNYRLNNETLELKTTIETPVPYVSQDFTTVQSVPSWLSFSRTTTATYFNANGVLSTASSGVARFGYEYVGSAWVPGGFLIETEQRTNLAIQSVNMQNAAWTVSGTTNATDTTLLPDGSTLAGKLTCVAGSAAHNIFCTSPYASATSDANYAQSWIVKAGTHPYIYVTAGTSGHVISAVFNLSNATATVASQTAVSGAGSTVFATKQVNLGNGYFRVTLVGSVTSTTLYQVVGFAQTATGNTFDSSGNITFTAAGTETIYFGMPQLEAGNYATSYIPTTSAAVTRAADVVTTRDRADIALTNVATSIIMEAKLKGNLSNGRLLNRSDSSVAALYLPGSQLGTYDGTNTSSPVTFGGGADPENGDIIRAGVAWNVGGSSIAGNGSNTTRVAWHAALNNSSYIFRDNTGGENINGFLRSMAIYDRRLRDAILISKTIVGAEY